MLKAIAKSKLGGPQKLLLGNLVQTYFELGPAEDERFEELVENKFPEVQKMQVTWADRMRAKYQKEGLEEGRQEGLQKGVVEGKRETLLRLLTKKFGTLPEVVTARVRALESADELDRYLDRVLTATTLDEMKLGE